MVTLNPTQTHVHTLKHARLTHTHTHMLIGSLAPPSIKKLPLCNISYIFDIFSNRYTLTSTYCLNPRLVRGCRWFKKACCLTASSPAVMDLFTPRKWNHCDYQDKQPRHVPLSSLPAAQHPGFSSININTRLRRPSAVQCFTLIPRSSMGVLGACAVGGSCLTNSRRQCLTHCMTSARNQVPLVAWVFMLKQFKLSRRLLISGWVIPPLMSSLHCLQCWTSSSEHICLCC